MTDRAILFSGPMIRALLEGRKTSTRRIAKITAIMGNKVAITSPDENLIELEEGEFRPGICHYESTGALSGPYTLSYAVGDRLWVREAHYLTDDGDYEHVVHYAEDAAVTEHRNTVRSMKAGLGLSDSWARQHLKLRPPPSTCPGGPAA